MRWILPILLLLLAGLCPPHAEAAGCHVTSPSSSASVDGSLPALLAHVYNDGGCATDDYAVREHYKPYLDMAQVVHLIYWTESMDIYLETALAALHAHQDMPLILQVASPDGRKLAVRVIGTRLTGEQTAVRIAGSGGSVILDGLTLTSFPGTALDISSDRHTILNTRVLSSGTATPADPLKQQPALRVRGRRNRILFSEIANNKGPGILVSENGGLTTCANVAHRSGERTRILESRIHDNGSDGIIINAFATHITESEIFNNGRHGVYVMTASIAAKCLAEAGEPIEVTDWHTAEIRETRFWDNGAGDASAIFVSERPLPPPVDLISVSPLTAEALVVVGNVSRFADPTYIWNDGVLDFSSLHIELFLADGSDTGQGKFFLTRIDTIDPTTRHFTAHLPYPMTIEGELLKAPVLTATVVDTEHGNTSPFSLPLDIVASLDWDGDGIPNPEEDFNHDGLVDGSETDPRLADSDGDSLTDGEEVLLSGHVAERIRSGQSGAAVLTDLRGLDPRNADSDGDCLTDGLEMGVSSTQLPPWEPVAGSVLRRPPISFSPACLTMFRDLGVLRMENAIAWDPAESPTPDNVSAIYDTDPASWTDPTNADTDGDGLPDGAEDWNADGARSAEGAADAANAAGVLVHGGEPQWKETDPTRADSDGDGLPDGDEGDRDGDQRLGPSETDPLMADTDGDGLQDADEVRTYGTLPNQCDSDTDGLADGLEAGVKNPYPDNPACRGLQSAGSNFESIEALNPLKIDSDNDGIPDGTEDANHNGWLDPEETDPTTADTDGDGLSDYVEQTGDLDQDQLIDVVLERINNGGSCAPPPTFLDLDCDGLPNARDEDSDNDGCLDREEGLQPGSDPHGIPAAYNAKVNSCGAKAAPSVGAGGGAPATPAGPAVRNDPEAAYLERQKFNGGGGCALVYESPKLSFPRGVGGNLTSANLRTQELK